MTNLKKLSDRTKCKGDWFARCLSGKETEQQVILCSKCCSVVRAACLARQTLVSFPITPRTPDVLQGSVSSLPFLSLLLSWLPIPEVLHAIAAATASFLKSTSDPITLLSPVFLDLPPFRQWWLYCCKTPNLKLHSPNFNSARALWHFLNFPNRPRCFPPFLFVPAAGCLKINAVTPFPTPQPLTMLCSAVWWQKRMNLPYWEAFTQNPGSDPLSCVMGVRFSTEQPAQTPQPPLSPPLWSQPLP